MPNHTEKQLLFTAFSKKKRAHQFNHISCEKWSIWVSLVSEGYVFFSAHLDCIKISKQLLMLMLLSSQWQNTLFLHLFTRFEMTFISCQMQDFKDIIPYLFDLFTSINASPSQSLSLPVLKIKTRNSLLQGHAKSILSIRTYPQTSKPLRQS